MSVGWLHFLADYYFSLTPTRACEHASSTQIHTKTHTRIGTVHIHSARSGYFLPFCPRYYITFSEQQGVRSVSLHINEKICDFPPSSNSSSSSRCRRCRTCEKRKSWKKKRVISHRRWILHLFSRPRLSLWICFLLLLYTTSAVITTL